MGRRAHLASLELTENRLVLLTEAIMAASEAQDLALKALLDTVGNPARTEVGHRAHAQLSAALTSLGSALRNTTDTRDTLAEYRRLL